MRGGISRRQAIVGLGAGTAIAAGLLFESNASTTGLAVSYLTENSGYAPDGAAGRTAAFPLSAVRLLDGPFLENQRRNTDYLLFLNPDRLLYTFRTNYGLPSPGLPCGGWEHPGSEVRGHSTGHLLSGLAIAYASTGSSDARAVGEYLVGQLAALQAAAPAAGFSPGYLSAFPERYFDSLEAGKPVWSPYYMIHKYLAGLIDQYQLAGVRPALDVAVRLADWVDQRTSRLSYPAMQQILNVEFGGLPEALVNLYSITGEARYLTVAERFYHAAFLDPLAAGQDNLDGQQSNVSTPKVTSCVRLWEETGNPKYRDIARNFWRIVTEHHTYAIGGSSNYEHWHAPDVIAAQLSNYTCEGCVSYNMLKLTRLLHFHQQQRVDLVDFYERALFNHLLGTQDPDSPHGFNCYYMGLSPGAFKQQPLNYFPSGDPDVYSTDYADFTCDTATGMETQGKFGDTIYSRDDQGVFVNLFIASEVTCSDQGIKLRQTTGYPDEPATRLTVVSGAARMAIRVRVPAWTAGPPRVVLNGATLPVADVFAGGGGAGGWIAVTRSWRPGDWLEVALPMRLELIPAPDDPAVQAVRYGPVVLAGLNGTNPSTTMPVLDTTTIRRVSSAPLTFQALADNREVTLVPVARAHHQHFTVYWRTA